MKGGNCCKFETAGDHCTEGPYAYYIDEGTQRETKTLIQFCSFINDVYVFFSIHVFKHMEDIDVGCYDIEGLIEKINDNLPNSYVAENVSVGLAKFNSNPMNCVFNKKNIEKGNSFIAFHLDPSIRSGTCNYYVFEKIEDDVINIFVLGNCDYDINGKNISFIPGYIYNDDDNVTTPIALVDERAADVHSNLNPNTIIDQYESQKKQQKIMSSSEGMMASYIQKTLEEPLVDRVVIVETKNTDNNTKTRKKKKASSVSLKATPTSRYLHIEEIIYSVPSFKKYRIVSRNTEVELKEVEKLMKRIDDDTIESAIIQFEGCVFLEPLPISQKVKIINLISCTHIPRFDDNNIYELNIVKGVVQLNINLLKWKLTKLRIIEVENELSFPNNLRDLSITDLVINNTIIQNVKCWETWKLVNLNLYYTTFPGRLPLVLPPIVTLKSLIMYISLQRDFFIFENMKTLKKCLLVSHEPANMCRYLSHEFMRVIKESNKVLAGIYKTTVAELGDVPLNDLMRNLSLLNPSSEMFCGKSNFQFSKDLIWDDRFFCDCFNVTNINVQTLEEVERMISIIFEKHCEEINNSFPLTPKA